MANLPFYDCNCMIGVRQWRHPVQPQTLDDFREDFAYYDIQAALVYHAAAREYAPEHGNRLLLRETGGDPRFIPQWVVLPPQTGEMPAPEELVDEMLARGVRAARLFPRAHNTSLRETVVGPLLEALQARRIPLFLDIDQLSFAEAEQVLQRFRLLPLVLTGVNWAVDRELFPLLEKYEHLHLDTWAYQNHRAYEVFVSRFGSERLLFSTGLPHRSPGAARMMTCYETLCQADRENIAGRNLLRLLANVRNAQGRPLPQWTEPPDHPDDDPITAAVRAGRPLTNEWVVDSHNHLGHPGSQGIDLCSIYHNDADALIGTMDRLGIDAACPSSWAGITYATPEANDHTLHAAAKYPGRILPYGCLNPSYPDLFREEFERLFLGKRVIGYKPAPFRQAVPLTDPVHFPVYDWCAEHKAPVLCGDGPARLAEIRELAPTYPGVTFINAHTGSSYDFARDTVAVARANSNVYAEITYTLIWYGIIEYLVAELGAERVLFGTDCIMRDGAPQLGWVAWARIPYEAKQKILGLNMAGILRLERQHT
jgi:uncharacterized protein